MMMVKRPDLGAAINLVISPQGIPFVRNTARGRVLWRLPGGHLEEVTRLNFQPKVVEVETPEEGAVRETEQETGFIIPIELVRVVSSEIRKNGHIRYLCVSRVPRLIGTQRVIGDGGEEIQLFTAHEALYNKGFLPDHRRLIRPFLEEEIAHQVSYLQEVAL
jgi:ADP-ribose pyrophosphatase YjhB (NUDIX family)